MIIMKIDRKNNDQIFFWSYIKLNQTTYVTNNISLKNKICKKIIKKMIIIEMS